MIKLGPEHVVFALSYNILDLVHDTLGDLKQAKDWHEWAPDIYLKKISDLGMLILQRLTITWVLYIVSWMTYRGQKTVRCAPWLFTWKKLGPEHVKVTTSYHNLRLGHWKVGDLQKPGRCAHWSGLHPRSTRVLWSCLRDLWQERWTSRWETEMKTKSKPATYCQNFYITWKHQLLLFENQIIFYVKCETILGG